MNCTPNSAHSVLRDLAAWHALALDVLTSSSCHSETARVHELKQQFLRLHKRHLAELRPWVERTSSRPVPTGSRPWAWSEVIAALMAPDEYVALAACTLLQRAVVAAHDRARNQVGIDPEAMGLVERHTSELRLCLEQHSRKPAANGSDTLSRPVARSAATTTRPVFSAALAT